MSVMVFQLVAATGGTGGFDGGNVVITTSGAGVYFGATTADGSWRIIKSGNNLAQERRESGSWNEKAAATP